MQKFAIWEIPYLNPLQHNLKKNKKMKLKNAFYRKGTIRSWFLIGISRQR